MGGCFSVSGGYGRCPVPWHYAEASAKSDNVEPGRWLQFFALRTQISPKLFDIEPLDWLYSKQVRQKISGPTDENIMKTPQYRQRFSAGLRNIAFFLVTAPLIFSQVNSGSDGRDGVLNPAANVVIDMTDHPDGIYHYASVNIPAGVTVTFLPNASNTPVTWLVQGNCNISGAVELNGKNTRDGGGGGIGGFRGGHAGSPSVPAGDGLGPGGGKATSTTWLGANASHGALGGVYPAFTSYSTSFPAQDPPGELYGNNYLVPLVGGSGGAGVIHSGGIGGGGGGAVLIAASGTITLGGRISANGGGSDNEYRAAGGGSGGAVRLVATTVSGAGRIEATGGICYTYYNGNRSTRAGQGRVRIDAMNNTFTGVIDGNFTFGMQPIIIPPPNQAVGLSIVSVGGVTVNASPAASPINPDLTVPANTQNPVSIVVKCVNIPLNTEVIVDVKPANGIAVRGVAFNNSGTQSLSYATIQMELPRGSGTIQAKAISGITNQLAAIGSPTEGAKLAETGWLATGEGFKAIEITSVLGGGQSVAYISDSGKRYSVTR